MTVQFLTCCQPLPPVARGALTLTRPAMGVCNLNKSALALLHDAAPPRASVLLAPSGSLFFLVFLVVTSGATCVVIYFHAIVVRVIPNDIVRIRARRIGCGQSPFGSVQLMLALEERFDVEFPDTLLNRRSFSTIRIIRDTVASLATARAA